MLALSKLLAHRARERAGFEGATRVEVARLLDGLPGGPDSDSGVFLEAARVESLLRRGDLRRALDLARDLRGRTAAGAAPALIGVMADRLEAIALGLSGQVDEALRLLATCESHARRSRIASEEVQAQVAAARIAARHGRPPVAVDHALADHVGFVAFADFRPADFRPAS